MKRIRKATLATLAAFALVTTTLAADGPAAARKERVSFARGAMSATIQGTLKGDGDVDYLVRAAAGQTLRIEFRASHGQNNFNVLPPGSTNVAMYSSRDTGERSYEGLLPADGDYTIRVWLDRPAARRHESSKYTLTVAVSGKPLAPLSATQDAKVAGTAYHATATVPCLLPYQPGVKSCDAGVIRRGRDGTATFEAIGRDGVQRRILFVQGKPVTADAMAALTFSRRDDLTTVRIGDDERYDIPDAFLTGG